MKSKLALTTWFLVLASLAEAKEIPREMRSSRYLGMGDAGLALAEGHDALFYNPAGISDTKGIVNEIVATSPEASISTNAWDIYKKVNGNKNTLDIVNAVSNKPLHANVQNFSGLVFKRAALGVYTQASTNAFVGTNPERGVLVADIQGGGRAGLVFGLSKSFFKDSLFLGSTMRLAHKVEAASEIDAISAESQFKGSKAKDLVTKFTQRGSGFGGDLGAIWVMNAEVKPRFGLTLRNVGTTTYSWTVPTNSAGPSAEKQTLDLGVSIAPGTKRSAAILAIEVRDLMNANKEVIYKRIHLGGRISFQNRLGFMAGLNQGYPTYGAFLDLYIVRVEGGVYSEELEKFPGDRRSKRMFGRVVVGWTK